MFGISISSPSCPLADCGIDHRLLTEQPRILANLLGLEDAYTLSFDYCKESSTLDASMRATLTTWMLEVCEEEKCTNEVFSLSVNLFDRCMAVLRGRVDKSHLQLLGVVCLFVAGKLKAHAGLGALKLVDYTAGSVTLEEVLEWELCLLERLRWDVAAVGANDYVEFLLHEFACGASRDVAAAVASETEWTRVRKHVYAFTALCSTDFKFAFYPASMIASACFLAALEGVERGPSQEDAKRRVAIMMNVDVDCLEAAKELVDELFKRKTVSSKFRLFAFVAIVEIYVK